MIEKLLVANRGEISVRIFRAAYELGIRSVAIHTPDDRGSVHRVNADEAYEIGERGHPVRAPMAGMTSQPAIASMRGDRQHSARDRPRARRAARPRALLGGRAELVCAVRERAERSDRPAVSP